LLACTLPAGGDRHGTDLWGALKTAAAGASPPST